MLIAASGRVLLGTSARCACVTLGLTSLRSLRYFPERWHIDGGFRCASHGVSEQGLRCRESLFFHATMTMTASFDIACRCLAPILLLCFSLPIALKLYLLLPYILHCCCCCHSLLCSCIAYYQVLRYCAWYSIVFLSSLPWRERATMPQDCCDGHESLCCPRQTLQCWVGVGGPVRDAPIQPRLVLVCLIPLLFTDDMRVSLTATFCIISLGVVLLGVEKAYSFMLRLQWLLLLLLHVDV